MKRHYKLVREKLALGERLKIFFLNDVGFQYGAGLAHLRQIQSFLLLGHSVKGLCWNQGPEEGNIPVSPHGAKGEWLGMFQMPKLHWKYGYSDDEIIDSLLQEVQSFRPDVIVVGNIHGAIWPLELLLELRTLDALVVAYMHDCFLVSGRCAYPGACQRYASGCNYLCPTPREYPPAKRRDIAKAWELRREIFCGPFGVPLAANSSWTASFAQRGLNNVRYVEVIHLGLDEKLFSPINKQLVRKLLGLPNEAFIVLSGSVNMSDPRKGGHIFQKVVKSLSKKVYFLVFGSESKHLKGVHPTGLLRDYRKMPLLYSAADVFLGTSIEEAFGQTLCEAAACAKPIVAFNVGGVPEVARHNLNARLVNSISAEGLAEQIEHFLHNPHECTEYGAAGRKLVEAEFSLRRQGERWMKFIQKVVQ